jgi:hypothetical protein
MKRGVALFAAGFIAGAVVSPALLYLFVMSLWSP